MLLNFGFKNLVVLDWVLEYMAAKDRINLTII